MNNDERVISLSDLFSVLLRNIVPIICVTLAFTLLGFILHENLDPPPLRLPSRFSRRIWSGPKRAVIF